jgi:hypothetical protein
MDEIEADFMSFYGVRDFEEVDGPKFLRLASKLIYREGAIKGKIQYDLQELEENGGTAPTSSKPVKTIKMSEAAGKYTDELDLIDMEGTQAGLGPLFERTTAVAQ